MELSVFRNEDASDRGFLSCDERCIPALKVDPAGENFLAISKARNCPPRNFQAVRRGCTYRLVLPSAGHLRSVPLQQQVAKIHFKKRSFYLLCRLLSCLSSVIGAIGLYRVLFRKTYLAEQTLMMGEMHNLMSAGSFPTSGRTGYREDACARRRGPRTVQELSQPVYLKQERKGASYLSFSKIHLFMTLVP